MTTVGLVAVTVVLVVVAIWSTATRRSTARDITLIASRIDRDPDTTASSLDQSLDRLHRAVTSIDGVAREAAGAHSLQSALMAIPHGLMVVDRDARVLFENATVRAFREGRHGESLVADAIDVGLTKAIGGEANDEVVHLYGPPGRALRISAQPLGTPAEVTGAVVLIDDLTTMERVEAMRRDFVANISHELRTPVGAMSLLAETLVDENDPAVAADLGGRLLIEAKRMSDTINDLLELSRIETDDSSTHTAVVLQTPVHDAVAALQAAADQSAVTLSVQVPAELVIVPGDQRQLRTAVFNLIDNAIKFAEPGHGMVEITVAKLHGVALLEVRDNGPGIPRRDLDRIFERFYRADKSRSRQAVNRRSGTGLGLSIVRHVVANHGGEIAVASVEGEGTTFTLEFPLSDDDDHSTERGSP